LKTLTQKQISLSQRLTLALAFVVTFVTILVASGFYVLNSNKLEKTFSSKMERTMSYLGGTLGPVLWNLDHDTVIRIAQTVLSDDFISGIVIWDEAKKSIYSTRSQKNPADMVRAKTVFYKGEKVGELELAFSRALLTNSLDDILWVSILVWFLALISITTLTYFFIRKYFQGPLLSFIDLAKSYREKPGVPVPRTTPFVEFQPIERVVKELANDVFLQLLDLKKSEAKYRRIFESVEDGYIFTDMNGTVLSVNPATTKMLEYDGPAMLIGKNIEKYIYSDEHQKERLKEKLMKNKTLKGHLLNFRKHDGGVLLAECNIHLVFDEAKTLIAVEGTFRDVTDRERAEQELKKHRDHLSELVDERTKELKKSQLQLIHSEKLASLGKLTGSISHEFNNPLQGVRNAISILSKPTLSDKELKLAKAGKKECDRMGKMIRGLRDFYKPTSNKVSCININQCLEEVLTLLIKPMQEMGIEVNRQLSDNLPKIEVVEDQIKQVLLNMIQNSSDSISREGQITLTTEKHDSRLRIKIQDTGRGISEDNIKLLFEPFFTTKDEEQGTGLGLSISYGIIQDHGGDIEVESELDKGTTFVVSLPIKRE
jgi:PAS domain S-box-containing protein